MKTQTSDLEISDNAGLQMPSDQMSDTNSTGSCPENGTSETETSEDEYISSILKYYPWYHGMMFNSTVEKLLKWEHSYLVRRTMHKSIKKILCLSMKVDGRVFNCQLNLSDEGWGCSKLCEKFPTFPKQKYAHVYQILDALSLVANVVIPIPRRLLVLYHSSITLENQLGKGAFGEVFKGKYLAKGASEPIQVAVKRAIGDARKSTIQEFCHEAQVMSVLQHANVVCLYGLASLEQPLMLVMELINGGDLKKYLQTTSNIPNKQLIIFAMDIASGMKHLVMKKVIHRDLAARNCLITKALLVKISDFGLSVQGQEVVVKKLKKAPIRWLSPETLNKGVFNEKTDVWSYGVLLTELMTRCAADPLSPRNLKEVQKWIKEAEHPHRIENGEPKELAELVDSCCDKKKSEERKSSTSTDRKTSNTNLTRKRSRDGRPKDKSTERRTGTQRKQNTYRRKDKGQLKLPTAMSTNQERPSPPTIPSTVSPTTPLNSKPPSR
uniref:Tyrosine-protein kinase n=1 Tax=Caenorhabditis tropicalis TaxID=1561998 RepID=A0A1I7TBE2_9PELO